ncbi:MAG: hypothetical protein ACKVJK_14230 [Methylophagaceae bacterium]|jgi:hypothetical protein|tara:strand:+ start:13339 stop:13800 length:462 start_codon:yes stop_codon:yes gene_type:complete
MPLTTNKNFLSPTGFQFKIDEASFPNVGYFCTAVTLPDISLAEAATPYRGSNIAFTGDRLTFSDLAIRFNVTEDMDNYIEMFNWMHNIINDGENYKFDATLSILTSHNNVSKEITFRDCFPTSLSALEFSTQQTDIEYLQADATFKYTYFEVK